MVKNEPIGKPARNKWIKAAEDPSLSPGKRIRLFCEISRQADKIIEENKNGNAEAERSFLQQRKPRQLLPRN